MKNGTYTISYFNGGCLFDIRKKEGVSIIGTYVSLNKPAAIKIKYGKGIVILSGVHFEYDPIFMDKNDSYLKPIVSVLSRSSLLARTIFKHFE